jgi:indolepyruvate ferredoxin oxidoreductase beta subunit
MIRYDILICGIGGQGTISLGTILKQAAIEQGLNVVGAERRGGAQREGIVTSNVRYFGLEPGEVYNERNAISGLIPIGGGDMMIAMEPLEALRHARYLNKDSIAIINDYPLVPVHVRIGDFTYPEKESIYSSLKEFTSNIHIFNIDELSRTHFNSLKQVNTISLGIAFALGRIPVSEKAILKVVKDQFPDFENNKRAFYLGMEIAKKF